MYNPETKQGKQRLPVCVEKKASGKADVPRKRPSDLRVGVNTGTALVENKKAPLILIAQDTDPTELIAFPSALCHNMGFSYCIIEEKVSPAMLYKITRVNLEDKRALAKLVDALQTNYNDRYAKIHCQLGGNVLGPKSVTHISKLEKAKAKVFSIK
ncbi:60S ribosomal protein L7a-like [Rattus rattus]|uniref:60S ribosomal protein L7a-like n=1 Tax=Rattus rattus TaxID=10117 RepID=UPI0013F2DE5C|nr:60S ribosomal protein L7a-like [Rattus rattus]